METVTDPMLALATGDDAAAPETLAAWQETRQALTAAGDVSAAALPIFAAVKAAESLKADRVVEAAYAVAALAAAGRMGKGNETAPGWMSNTVIAAHAGVAPSNVTKWVTLGHAFTVVGVEPGTVLHRCLQHRGLAERATVKAAIMADGATVESVLDVVRTYVETDSTGAVTGVLSEGKRAARLAGAEGNGDDSAAAGSDTGDKGDDKGKGIPLSAESILENLTPLAAAKLALAILHGACPALDSDQWEAVEGTMHKVITRETLNRRKAAEQSA